MIKKAHAGQAYAAVAFAYVSAINGAMAFVTALRELRR